MASFRIGILANHVKGSSNGFHRVAAWSACAAAASISVPSSFPKRTSHNSLKANYCSSPDRVSPLQRRVFCQSAVPGPSKVHFENERLRVTEVKLRPGESASLKYEFPHLRWEVVPAGPSQTPKPTFHDGGQSHALQTESGKEHREYVFEFLAPPKYGDREFKERQAAAWYHGSPGTEFMFENEYCVAYDFRVPAKGGDVGDMHQHIVDHFFVMLDLPCSLEVYVPQTDADLPAADRRVHNVRRVGSLDCPDESKSWRYYGEVGNGGFVDGKPKLGPAVHGVSNPGSQEFREYYIDLK